MPDNLFALLTIPTPTDVLLHLTSGITLLGRITHHPKDGIIQLITGQTPQGLTAQSHPCRRRPRHCRPTHVTRPRFPSSGMVFRSRHRSSSTPSTNALEHHRIHGETRYLIHGPSQKGYGRQTRYDSLPLSLA